MPADTLNAGRVLSVAFGILLLTILPLMSRNDFDWYARAWQSDEGLPNNTVTGIAQTRDGYLWLATSSGLTSFDGINFQQFSLMEMAGQPNRGILAMALNHNGGLILAMDRGAIVCLNADEAQVFKVHVDLPDRVPQNIAEDGTGTIWIAYRGGDVWKIKGGKAVPVTAKDGLPDGPAICSFAVDDKGQLWFSKSDQLGLVRNGQFQTLLQLDHAPTCLAAAHDGGIWICAGLQVFKYMEGGQLEAVGSFNPDRAGTEPTVLLEDRNGALWIGTSSSGLFRYADSSFEKIKTSHSQILSLMEDREGNLWVGTGGGGLNRIRPRTVELKGAETGLPEAVQSICEDKSGTLWATTQSGLLGRWTDDKWTPVSTDTNWPGDATCVLADPSGAVWVGTQHYGLFCWRDGHFIPWGETKKLQGHTIRAMLLAKNGDVWLGEESPNALQRLRAGKLQNFQLPPDMRLIRAITEDPSGNIWIGTSKGALLRVAGDKLDDETALILGGSMSIRYLCATPDDSLWIGFAGWGLGRLKNGQFTDISTPQGLYDDYISQIIPDNSGFLWFGSNRGIFKVRQQELNDVAEGHAAYLQSIHYGPGEGLPNLQANFGNSPGALRSQDGRLWIPMRSGMVVINPDSSQENLSPPPVLINRVVVDERILSQYRGIMPVENNNKISGQFAKNVPLKLSPYYHRLEFDYTALSFVAPENVQFRYRLEGVDKDWTEAGTQRSVTYSRLPSAHYRFQVIAGNKDGVWNKGGADFNFEVMPFFWETWSFRLIALVAFTLCVIVIVRYISFRRLQLQLQQAKQQAALHKERARIAKDIHDDLGANLTQIALLSELVRQDSAAPPKAEEHTEKISANARQAIKSLDEIVWAVNPRNDTLAQLVDYTGQFALDYLQSAGIRCRLDFPDQMPEREVPTDVRHNLFLVVKETLNNVVKHAHADEVWLRLSATDEMLRIEIEDNGRGLGQPSDSAGADGLRNMRQRMKEIGGECQIEGRAGSGMKITVIFPWPRH